MSNRELMRITAKWRTFWPDELVIAEDAVYAKVLQAKRVDMTLRYDSIAQVNLHRGIFTADLELVNRGGTGNLIVKSLNKQEAEAAKVMIERKMYEHSINNTAPGPPSASIADELRKLADLKDQGILTADEFEVQKQQILSRTQP